MVRTSVSNFGESFVGQQIADYADAMLPTTVQASA
jgi:hypothetical protein